MKNNSIFSGLSEEILKKRKKISQPDFVPPMLATLNRLIIFHHDWIYEHKFDGQRCLVIKKKGRVHFYPAIKD